MGVGCCGRELFGLPADRAPRALPGTTYLSGPRCLGPPIFRARAPRPIFPRHPWVIYLGAADFFLGLSIEWPRPMGADADVARASMKARAVAFEMPASKGPRIDGGPGPTGAIGA